MISSSHEHYTSTTAYLGKLHDRHGYHSILSIHLIPPNPDRLVLPSTADLLAIRTPVHGKDLVLVPGKIHRQFARAHIPHLQRGVLGRGDQKPGVGGKTALVDGADVAAECRDESSGCERWVP